MSDVFLQKIWETALGEHMMAGTADDGQLAVIFLAKGKLEYMIGVADREQQLRVIVSFRNMFTEIYTRFLELHGMMKQLETIKGDEFKLEDSLEAVQQP